MVRHTTVLITMLFAGVALLLPAWAAGQQASSLGKLDASVPDATTQRVTPDPFQRPGIKPHSVADENAHADSVPLLQSDGSWSRAYAQYAFAAPPGFYGFGQNPTTPTAWDSALTGVFAVYLDHSGTFTRMTTNLELDGERREASASGNPGAQALTMEWEWGRLMPSRLGSLEFAAGIYRQRLLSYASFANSPIADTLAGSPISGGGIESSVTLPDHNLTLTFRYGSQHLDHAGSPSRVTMFEISRTW